MKHITPEQRKMLSAELERRALKEAAEDANWYPALWRDQLGWGYPVYNAKGDPYLYQGEIGKRWKNFDSGGNPKYAWVGRKPERNGVKPRYYLLPDTVKAIQKSKGVLYIAGGEPDVLAYRAAGIKNVLCWFDGEGSVPKTIAQDLQDLAVSGVFYAPDADNAGYASAWKLFDALKMTDITLIVNRLPFDMGSKKDTADLWKVCNANPEQFIELLGDLPLVDADDLYKFRTGREAEPLQPVLPTPSEKSFNPDFITAIERGLGVEDYKSNGFSRDFCCPFHDDNNPSAGWHGTDHYLKCWVCGTKNAKDTAAKLGIDWKDFHDREPYQVLPATPPAPDAEPTDIDVALMGTDDWYTDLSEAFDQLAGIFTNDFVPPHVPTAFPFRTLHRFGGFAELSWTGKVTFFVGLPGGGKTMVAEHYIKDNAKAGYDTIIYSPEWTALEFTYRALQRAGGAKFNEMGNFVAFQHGAANGVPKHERFGYDFGKATRNDNLARIQAMQAWLGTASIMQPGDYSLTELLERIQILLERKRAEGRNVRTLVIDYLQTAPAHGKRDWMWGETVTQRIKTFCEMHDLNPVIFVQPKKGDVDSAKNGNKMSTSGGQGVSDQKANLVVTIKPYFDASGNKYPFAKWTVAKNNTGSMGSVFMAVDWSKMQWLDREAPNVPPEIRNEDNPTAIINEDFQDAWDGSNL